MPEFTTYAPVAINGEELRPDASTTFSLKAKTESCTANAGSEEPVRVADTMHAPELCAEIVPRSIAENEVRAGALSRERKYGAEDVFKETRLFDKTEL